jgi:uncharacterized lipoprotein YmbA
MRWVMVFCALLLGGCAGGQPINGPTDPNYTACFKAPSQQSIAEHNYCVRRYRDAA